MLTTWNSIPMLDRVFDDVMGSALGYATKAAKFTPAVDVIAREDEIVFQFDVPGVKLEEIEVTLENHLLSVRGRRSYEPGQKQQALIGRTFGDFQVAYTLPETVDDEKLTACLADGVLTLRVPKLPKAQPRKIQIGSGTPQLGR